MKFQSFPLFLLIVSSGIAWGQTLPATEESFAVAGVPLVHVRNENGRTEVSAGSDGRVFVKVQKEVVRASSVEEAERLAEEVKVRVEQRGDRIEVETRYPKTSYHRRAHVLVHIQIEAPRESNLDVGTEDGPLRIAGLEGELRAHSEDGEVQVVDCAGTLDLSVEDGDAILERYRGRLRSHLEDGNLRMDGALTGLSAESEDGDIELRLAPESVMSDEWTLRAEDGGIRVVLPDAFAANLDVHTSDGSIHVDVPGSSLSSLKEGRLSTILNGGGHRFSIRTEDGSVRLTKS